MMKKMDKRCFLIINRFERKLEALFMILFGKIFILNKRFVFEKNLSTTCFETRDKAEVDVRAVQWKDILDVVTKFKKFRGGEIEKRLRAGHLCFIAEKKGCIVGYKWVSFNETYVAGLERTIRTDSDSAYIYDAFTVPECRGQGITGQISARIYDHLLQTGIKKTYEIISKNNFSALRYAEKTELRNMGEVTLTRLFNSRVYRLKGKTMKDSKRIKELFSI
jgi:GNAT superfamily N-acetyltransferase